MIIIYSTYPNKEEAKLMAKALLEAKLIACANIYPIESLYNWENKIQDEIEFVLWTKSDESKKDEIMNFIDKKHSYDVPCVVSLNMDSTSNYSNWVRNELI